MSSELRQAVENERDVRDTVWALAVGPNDESEMAASRAARATAVNRTNAAIACHERIEEAIREMIPHRSVLLPPAAWMDQPMFRDEETKQTYVLVPAWVLGRIRDVLDGGGER